MGKRLDLEWKLMAFVLFQPLPAASLFFSGFPQQQTLSQDSLPSVHPEQLLLRGQTAHSSPIPCQTEGCFGALNYNQSGGIILGCYICPCNPRTGRTHSAKGLVHVLPNTVKSPIWTLVFVSH